MYTRRSHMDHALPMERRPYKLGPTFVRHESERTKVSAPVIYIFNLKGGVGKTATTVNLAAEFGRMGKKTLVVDLDPQCASTWSLGVAPQDAARSVYYPLMGKGTLQDVIRTSSFANVDLAPASEEMYGLDIDIEKAGADREKLLASALAPLRDRYQIILLDSHNKYGLTELNALRATDHLLVPVSCSVLPFWGLTQLHHLVGRASMIYNHPVETIGYLLTMFHRKVVALHSESKDVEQQLRTRYGAKVFNTVIDFDENIDIAVGHQEPVVYYRERARGSREYAQLAKEVVSRMGSHVDGVGSHGETVEVSENA